MHNFLLRIARLFNRGETPKGVRERGENVTEAFALLYTTPLALAGVVWLILATDLEALPEQIFYLLGLLALFFLFEQYDFYTYFEIQPGNYASWQENLWSLVHWPAVLVFGPNGLWPFVLWAIFSQILRWRRDRVTRSSLNIAWNLTLDLTRAVLLALAALSIYPLIGGSVPMTGLTRSSVLPALGISLIWQILSFLLWLPYIWQSANFNARMQKGSSAFWRFSLLTTGWHLLVMPYAVLLAGLFVQNGLGVYLYLLSGTLLVSLMASQLSRAADRSHMRSRELGELERMSQALLLAPPDASTLPQVLHQHIPSMFASCYVDIRLFNGETLFRSEHDSPAADEAFWDWARSAEQARVFPLDSVLPWNQTRSRSAVVTVPIVLKDHPAPIGALFLARQRSAEQIDATVPAAQSLAAQIAAALDAARIYARTLAHQRVEQELQLAGEIQASLLPDELPALKGWDFSAALLPARETSGDFYDIIPLPNGRVALVIADVADKGMGAALYMALSRTLIRTYAVAYHTRPDYVMRVANQRILKDTRADLFVTVFYAVLDPISGELTYCNAGHNPPCWLRADSSETPLLRRTGIPLGIYEDVTWEQMNVRLQAGDRLVLYTDGITEAQNAAQECLGDEPFYELLKTLRGQSAAAIHQTVLETVAAHSGGVDQSDDITLMVVACDELGSPAE